MPTMSCTNSFPIRRSAAASPPKCFPTRRSAEHLRRRSTRSSRRKSTLGYPCRKIVLTQRRVTAAQAGLAICSEPSRAKRVPREAESLSGSVAQPQLPNSAASAPLRLCVEKNGIRIAIIPLLFEAHWEKNFDIICCVVSSREKQIERMMTTRGMTRAEAEARLAAQMPVEEKAKRSHYVIHNDGTAEELKVQAAAFLKFVMQKQMQPKLPND